MGDFGYSKQSIKNLLGVTAGEVVGDSQTATLSGKTIDADSNTITNIENADIKAAAGIAKSKLAALDIVNADVNASAAIAKTKLAALDIVNADVNASAGIVQSKLATLAIGATELSDNAVDTNAIQANAVTLGKLYTGIYEDFVPQMSERRGATLNILSSTGVSHGLFGGDITTVGTHSVGGVSNTEGVWATWTTGAVSGNQAGVRTTGSRYRMDKENVLRARFSLGTATLVKFFIGFVNASFPAGTGVAPLANLHGFGLYGETAASANFRILHNDGGATAVSEELTSTVALNTTTHTVDIRNVGTTFTLDFDNGNVKNVTTDVPLTAQSMTMNCFVETRTSAARTMNLMYLDLREGEEPGA